MHTLIGHLKLQARALALLVAAFSVLATGCVYRMNIQQGNFLEDRTIEQLKVGMTRSQVRYLLGTPMVPDAFNADRWDYLYYMKKGRLRAPQQQLLTVFFEEDKVARIDHHDSARPAPQVAEQSAPKPAP